MDKTLAILVQLRQLTTNPQLYDLILSYKFREDTEQEFLEASEIVDPELIKVANRFSMNLYPECSFEIARSYFFDYNTNEHSHSMLGNSFVLSYYTSLDSFQIKQVIDTLMHAQTKIKAELIVKQKLPPKK